MIYFLQSVEGGAVKIGCSADVERRHVELEARYARRLSVLAIREGGFREERAIHARFGHLRFKGTEQFRPAAELMEFIGRPVLVDANPDTVEAMPDRYGWFGSIARLADDVAEDAKIAASLRGVGMAQLVTEILRPIVKKMAADEMRKRLEDWK